MQPSRNLGAFLRTRTGFYCSASGIVLHSICNSCRPGSCSPELVANAVGHSPSLTPHAAQQGPNTGIRKQPHSLWALPMESSRVSTGPDIWYEASKISPLSLSLKMLVFFCVFGRSLGKWVWPGHLTFRNTLLVSVSHPGSFSPKKKESMWFIPHWNRCPKEVGRRRARSCLFSRQNRAWLTGPVTALNFYTANLCKINYARWINTANSSLCKLLSNRTRNQEYNQLTKNMAIKNSPTFQSGTGEVEQRTSLGTCGQWVPA